MSTPKIRAVYTVDHKIVSTVNTKHVMRPLMFADLNDGVIGELTLGDQLAPQLQLGEYYIVTLEHVPKDGRLEGLEKLIRDLKAKDKTQ